MLSWIKKKLFLNKSAKISAEHRKLIDPEALNIVRKLRAAGYESYIVGGCVRDLLLGIAPKDFDIATQASPQQVKSLISRSFIIGKRFRIVVAKRWPKGYTKQEYSALNFDAPISRPKEHEYQITTFRRAPVTVNGSVNENVFGTAAEDAERRDFTLNGLFLEPASGRIVDFVEGIPDLNSKKLRVIGDPWVRFKEDPIRLLRALRFVMRAELSMTKDTQKAFEESLPFLKEAKKERIREELLKILKEGRAEKTFKEFERLSMWKLINVHLFELFKKTPQSEEQLFKLAKAIDKTPWKHFPDSSPLFAALLLPLLLSDPRYKRLSIKEWPPELLELADELKISKKEREDISHSIHFLEKILKDPQAKHSGKMLSGHIRHPEIYMRNFYILKICAEAGLDGFVEAWKNWKDAWVRFHDEHIAKILNQGGSSSGSRRPRSRRGPRRRPQQTPTG